MKNIVAVFAVAEEVIYLPDVVSLVTGIGKTNAAFAMTKLLMEQKPDVVLNIGTVGTTKYHVGDIIVAKHFVDRDYDKLRAYGVESEIEFQQIESMHLPSIVEGKETYTDMIVNTGDDFVTAESVIRGDVVDMEAYALATACKRLGVPMVSVKYVTDLIGQNSLQQWEEKLSEARMALKDYFDKYFYA